MQRINVVGTSGSGKSTFAQKLASKLDYPYIELDRLFWEPNWVQADSQILNERIEQAINRPNWVIDGNYSKTEPVKWRDVTDVIWLDYSYSLTCWRALKRATHRIFSGKEIWPGTGNKETIWRTFFSHDSILLWTLTSHSSVKKKITERMNDPSLAHINFVRLTSPLDSKRFLKSLDE